MANRRLAQVVAIPSAIERNWARPSASERPALGWIESRPMPIGQEIKTTPASDKRQVFSPQSAAVLARFADPARPNLEKLTYLQSGYTIYL